MEIPTNMHLLTFLAACVLFTTTECATSYQDCPGGSVDVEQNRTGVLTCDGYSAAQITWEFMSGGSSFITIGYCTNSSTCTQQGYSNIFNLTAITGTSSQLTLTPTYTAGLKSVTFACDGAKCVVNISEPVPPSTTPEATTEATTEVVTTGTEESSSSSPDTPADTETSVTMSNSTTPALSTQTPTTTEGQNATDSNESPQKYVAVYVGAGFAGLVVIILVVAIVVLRRRSCKKKAKTMTNDQATKGATSARGRAVPREDTRM